jgi:low temperature requirement protein LtrA
MNSMADIQAPRVARRLARMSGRDPRQEHRAATPLELLFDLAFVAAFAQAGNEFAHVIAVGHVVAALTAFGLVMFAVCWAWMNFTWFASAYDTDDWFYRLTTLVQMLGVVILALGVPDVFQSVEQGDHVDNGIVVAGYVVMRIALVAQWIRVSKQDPVRRRTALTYVFAILFAQFGWVTLALLDLPLVGALVGALLLFLVELTGPVLAERKTGGTPWHPHHIAERYGLLTIITLGEGVLGTVLVVSVLVETHSWTADAVLVMVAGLGITFGMWWSYFIARSGEVLALHRQRSWSWSYGHVAVFASIAAVGAGLHVVAYFVEGVTVFGVLGAVLAVAVPVLAFTVSTFGLYSALMREFDVFHLLLTAGSVAALVAAIVLAANGASLGVCLVLVTLAPGVVIVGYETVGHRHQAEALARQGVASALLQG